MAQGSDPAILGLLSPLLGRAHLPISQVRRVKFRGVTPGWQHPGLGAGVPSRDQEATKPLSSDTLEAYRCDAPGYPGLSPEGLQSILLKQESEKKTQATLMTQITFATRRWAEVGGIMVGFTSLPRRMYHQLLLSQCSHDRQHRPEFGWYLLARLSPEQSRAGRWGPSTCKGRKLLISEMGEQRPKNGSGWVGSGIHSRDQSLQTPLPKC